MSEKELKKRCNLDRAIGQKFKKRHRKDLTADEIQAVINATKKPFHFYKDVAKEFRIPVTLVGSLVKDSEKRPEKLEARRQ